MEPSMKIVKSSNGETFEIDMKTASQSQTIKLLIEDLDNKSVTIPVPNVTGKILSKVIDYCKKHSETPTAGTDKESDDCAKEIEQWDKEFVKVDQDTLFDLLMAADYLNIQPLLILICQSFADIIKGKNSEQIRRIFGIKNDFTPEEEEEHRKENPWILK